MVPILVTLVAGLSTVLGAVLASRVKNKNIGAFSLAFATGLMLMISLGEMLPESFEGIGVVYTLLFMVLGAFLSLALDLIFPHHHDDEDEPGHYIHECECSHSHVISKGMVLALVLHNIVEGVATGVATQSNLHLGMSMAFGIAIHNVPIGATLAVSVMSAGSSMGQAVLKAVLVGLAQPLGALLGVLFLHGSQAGFALSACMAIVAGILVFISFDELWPAARRSGSRNLTIIALLLGICFIPLSEMLLPF